MKRWFAGPEPGAPDSPETPPAAGGKPLAARPGVLVVAPDRPAPGVFASLLAAVGAAKTGDVIELDFDGRREERPLTLSNITLEIRAAEGRRPVITFRPADADPVGYPRSMITVAGGVLRTSGVQWELDVPRLISADAWTLFETRRAEAVRLDRTVLTIRNASASGSAFHPAVAFFDVKSPPGSDSMAMKTGPLPTGAIDLTDSLVRGEATILRCDELEPVRLSVTQSLIASTETLLLARGANAQIRPGSQTRIELDAVTALVYGGLVRMSDDESSSHLLPTTIHVDNSLLITAAEAAWIDQRGIDSVERFQELIEWSAARVLFVGNDAFWRISTLQAGQTTRLDFAAWKSFWGASRERDCRHVGEVDLPRPSAQDRASAVSPLTLGMALRPLVAVEGSDAGIEGCSFDRLPLPTTEPADE